MEGARGLGPGEPELLAQLSLQHFRALRLSSLRWLGVASFPIWAQAHWHALPDLLAWLAFLAAGCCLATAAFQAALEHRAASRFGSPLAADLSGVTVHAPWSEWHELRSALWWCLALVSLVPWIYLGLARPLPAPLLAALDACSVGLLLLVAAAEVGVRQRAALSRGPHA